MVPYGAAFGVNIPSFVKSIIVASCYLVDTQPTTVLNEMITCLMQRYIIDGKACEILLRNIFFIFSCRHKQKNNYVLNCRDISLFSDLFCIQFGCVSVMATYLCEY